VWTGKICNARPSVSSHRRGLAISNLERWWGGNEVPALDYARFWLGAAETNIGQAKAVSAASGDEYRKVRIRRLKRGGGGEEGASLTGPPLRGAREDACSGLNRKYSRTKGVVTLQRSSESQFDGFHGIGSRPLWGSR